MPDPNKPASSEIDAVIAYAPVIPRPRWFRRRGTWIVAIAVLILLSALVVAGYFYLKAVVSRNLSVAVSGAMSNAFAPHALPSVSEQGWQQMSVGMTKAQVMALLGDSAAKHDPATTTVNGKTVAISKEYWEYNWTDGVSLAALLAPSDKAYVVYCGSDGTVTSFRRPIASTSPTTFP